MIKIPFNKPFLTGKETVYIEDAVNSGKISGNGIYTKKCQEFFQEKWGFKKVLLTTSCTDALEMAAILANVGPGDEVIIPSYTFVSTANPFLLRGAKVIFADSSRENPNIDVNTIERLVNKNTKAIVVVHYAGIACDMDRIKVICNDNKILLIEDAAQAIDSYYKGKPLGSFGDLATFSFHETKNIISGEGGLLVINNSDFASRSEVIWEKGTNRSAFFKGEVDKYGWVDIGSSFLPSEIVAAFLFAQLENLDKIQSKRISIWNKYSEAFKNIDSSIAEMPKIPEYATNNAHMFYLVWANEEIRDAYIAHMKSKGILTVFHYLSLHKSSFYLDKHDGRELPLSDYYTQRLVRLPLFYELDDNNQELIINQTMSFIHDLSI
ncbi:MAG: dTDP-4-amino-4,6-dideoxygalactose transaminase [Crocinitomicaceae bacterium]